MTKGNGVEFMKKLGIVAGAIIAVGTIVSWISGKAWVLAMQPIVSEWNQQLSDERHARQFNDSLLVVKLNRNDRDRFELLELLLSEPKARAAKVAQMRERWKKQNGHTP